MKDFETKHKEVIEVTAEQQQEKKQAFFDRIVPHNGHTLFEIEIPSMIIRRAKFEDGVAIGNYVGSKTSSGRRKVIIKEGCLYVSALNKKNAIKKLTKANNGSKK